jgi:hypothetical protein
MRQDEITMSMSVRTFENEKQRARDWARAEAYKDAIAYIEGIGAWGYTEEWKQLKALIDERQLANEPQLRTA